MNSQRTDTLSRSFYSAGILMLIFSNLGSALHYVFQAMMARNLSTADFGLMNALFSLIGFLSLPIGIYTNSLARQWAELTNVSRHEETDRLWYALVVAAGAFCLVGILVALCFAPWMAWWLKTTNLTVIVVAVVGAGFGIVINLANPLMVARQWFILLAMGGVMAAFCRIGIAWLGIQWSVPLSGAVAATTLYGGVLAIAVFWRVRWPGWHSLPFKKLLLSRREWVAPMLAAIATFCIVGSDLLVIRRLYEPHQAGVFAQVMVLGRIILYLIGPLSTVIFPKTATSLLEGASFRETRVVRRALTLSAVILFVAASVISILAPLGFILLRGSSDPELVRLLRIAVWCLIPLSLCQLVIPSLFARRQERYLLEFALLSILLPVGLAVFRGNLIYAFLVEGSVGLLLLGFVTFRVAVAHGIGGKYSRHS